VYSLFFALLFSLCLGHGTVISPAMRYNPDVNGGWCAWCQGSQIQCDGKTFCDPPTPCWGAKGPTTIAASYFGTYSNIKDSNGDYWVDRDGGNDKLPIWCPSQNISFNFFLNADHNGIYQFQIMSGKPGDEKEELFKPFTDWKSINMDNDTTYYAIDGVTPLKPHICQGNNAGVPWGPEIAHCRDNSLFHSSFVLPASQPPGNAIFRWIWYGAMTVDGKHVNGPEPSLFVNCKDVMIGTPEQCKSIV